MWEGGVGNLPGGKFAVHVATVKFGHVGKHACRAHACVLFVACYCLFARHVRSACVLSVARVRLRPWALRDFGTIRGDKPSDYTTTIQSGTGE